jgi:hypothetical protein
MSSFSFGGHVGQNSFAPITKDFYKGNAQQVAGRGLGYALDPGGMFDANMNQFQAQAYDPNAGAFGLGSDPNQMRSYQDQLLAMLADRAAGRGTSPAELQRQQAFAQAIAAQQGLAASNRSISPALAQRMAAQNVAGLNQQDALTAALLRAQETQAAQGQMGQLGVAQMQSQGDLERLRAQQYADAQRINAGVSSENTGQADKAQSGAFGAIGQIAGAIFSDERLKRDVKDEGDSLDEFVRSVRPKSYDYVDRGDLPKGRQYGVMAQDLERSRIGKTLVLDTPKGKMIDTARGYGALLAALGRVEQRLSAVGG